MTEEGIRMRAEAAENSVKRLFECHGSTDWVAEAVPEDIAKYLAQVAILLYDISRERDTVSLKLDALYVDQISRRVLEEPEDRAIFDWPSSARQHHCERLGHVVEADWSPIEGDNEIRVKARGEWLRRYEFEKQYGATKFALCEIFKFDASPVAL